MFPIFGILFEWGVRTVLKSLIADGDCIRVGTLLTTLRYSVCNVFTRFIFHYTCEMQLQFKRRWIWFIELSRSAQNVIFSKGLRFHYTLKHNLSFLKSLLSAIIFKNVSNPKPLLQQQIFMSHPGKSLNVYF